MVDPLIITVLVINIGTVLLQISQMIKTSNCKSGCCSMELETRETNPNNNNEIITKKIKEVWKAQSG